MWALLPLKNFANAKQRLSSVLTAQERSGLFHAMVNDVLTVLQQHPDIENTLIVSGDPAAKQLAKVYGAEFFAEVTLHINGSIVTGLNDAVDAGVNELAKRGIDDVMIIHGDLPLITAEEISHLISTHRQHSTVSLTPDLNSDFTSIKLPALTIAPDEHRTGTNCLLCSPASSMTYCYGANSFNLHAIEASLLEMPLQVVYSEGLACDIDTPEDLAILIERADSRNSAHSYRYIIANDLLERVAESLNLAQSEPAAELTFKRKLEPVIEFGMQYSWVS